MEIDKIYGHQHTQLLGWAVIRSGLAETQENIREAETKCPCGTLFQRAALGACVVIRSFWRGQEGMQFRTLRQHARLPHNLSSIIDRVGA